MFFSVSVVIITDDNFIYNLSQPIWSWLKVTGLLIWLAHAHRKQELDSSQVGTENWSQADTEELKVSAASVTADRWGMYLQSTEQPLLPTGGHFKSMHMWGKTSFFCWLCVQTKLVSHCFCRYLPSIHRRYLNWTADGSGKRACSWHTATFWLL